MQKLLFLIAISIAVEAPGQNIIRGQVRSIVDNKPVPYFRLQTGKKQAVYTDSTGLFSVSTKKNKVKLSFDYTINVSVDTTLFITDSLTPVTLFTANSWDSSQATYDIAHNTIWLFCCFGFFVIAPTPQDAEFEKEFGVTYFIVGDAPPAPVDRLRSYNRVVGEYLDRKYGTGWRKRTKARL